MTIVFCHWKQHIQQTKDTLASSILTIHSLYAAKWKLLLIPLFGDISHINFYLESYICAPFRSLVLCDKGRLKCVWKYSAVFSILLLLIQSSWRNQFGQIWNQSESDLWIHTHSWIKLPTGPWKRENLTLIWMDTAAVFHSFPQHPDLTSCTVYFDHKSPTSQMSNWHLFPVEDNCRVSSHVFAPFSWQVYS